MSIDPVRFRLEISLEEEPSGVRHLHALAHYVTSEGEGDDRCLMSSRAASSEYIGEHVDRDEIALRMERLLFELAKYFTGPLPPGNVLAVNFTNAELRQIADIVPEANGDLITAFRKGKFPARRIQFPEKRDRGFLL